MRQAIKSYFNEQPHRRASKKNHKKKYYRQQIKIYTNNNLVVNLTNHQLEKPLKYILYKGLKFIPTPSNTHKQTIVNSFKRIRRSMYIHYHFRHFSKKTTQSIQNKQFMDTPSPRQPQSTFLHYLCCSIHSTHIQTPYTYRSATEFKPKHRENGISKKF